MILALGGALVGMMVGALWGVLVVRYARNAVRRLDAGADRVHRGVSNEH